MSDAGAISTRRVWFGDPPLRCDACSASVADQFVDGALRHGPWAIMCPTCHSRHGRGLGTGRGQHYVRAADGRLEKRTG